MQNRKSSPMQPEVMQNALATPKAGHGFEAGDLVELPIYPKGSVTGRLTLINHVFRGKRYQGLVLVADEDGRIYEFVPELARRLPP